jgi:hypothetical protein
MPAMKRHGLENSAEEISKALNERAGESDVDLTSTRYAEELRAVGQALEAQGRFVSVEIEAQGSGYWVRAEADESAEAEESFGSVLKRTFRSLVQSDSRTIELHYGAEEIQKLVQDGKARRRGTNAAPDFFSLSQTLRMAGTYIDGLGLTTLIGVVVRDRGITIRYSQIKESKQDIQVFYDYSVKMYLHRKTRSAPM